MQTQARARFVRVSAQAYNAPADYELLAVAIRAVLTAEPSDT